MLAHKGHIKIHPVTAHVLRNGEGLDEHLEPKLYINFADDEWHSDARKGRNPEWDLGCHWKHHVHDPQNDVHFKLIDHKGVFHKDQPIAHMTCKIADFCHHEGEKEFELMLHHEMHEGAKLLIKVHFERDH